MSSQGNHGKTAAKAHEVIWIPLPAAGSFQAPVTTTTSAVIVQTTTVSTKGSSSATMPSRTGSSVRAAAWMIADEPVPASLLNIARRKPWISTPTKPPAPACHEKASRTMLASVDGSCAACASRIHRPQAR